MFSENSVEENDYSRKRKTYSSQRSVSSGSLPSTASSSTLYSDCSPQSTLSREKVGNYSMSSSQTSLAGSSCNGEQFNDCFHPFSSRPGSSSASIGAPEYSVNNYEFNIEIHIKKYVANIPERTRQHESRPRCDFHLL